MKMLIALVTVVLVFTHLPWILIGLLVYLFVIRRFAHHGHTRAVTLGGADPAQTSVARLTQTSPTSMPTFW